MIFKELPLAGAYSIIPNRLEDERGYFARTFCRITFRGLGLADCSLQCSISVNKLAGTLRGLHYQSKPHAESKLVRCARGAIFDVIVDLRTDSPTFGRWHGAELTQINGCAIYVPRGFAHGFITLFDDTEVNYQIADEYIHHAACGVRWDDPDIAISWPIAPRVISENDRKLPRLSDLKPDLEFQITTAL
jgi:dTDP-4-dehydrorhamnose 3,5-epimerase